MLLSYPLLVLLTISGRTNAEGKAEPKAGDLLPPVRAIDGSKQTVLEHQVLLRTEKEEDKFEDNPPAHADFLWSRQTYCDPGYGMCNDRARCCPLGGACCTVGK